MTTISPDLFTVVIHFDLPPESRHNFVADLVATVEETIATLEGFRSATFYVNDDGSVINLAQWDSEQIYESSMAADSEGKERIGRLIERHGATNVQLSTYQIARMIGG